MDMDFTEGTTALLHALALSNDGEELTKKIDNVLASIHDEKAGIITALCEVLALQKQEADRKKDLVQALGEIMKWWSILTEDREKLLITISTLEMEKEEIIKKQGDPENIYGALLEATSRKKPRIEAREMETQTDSTTGE